MTSDEFRAALKRLGMTQHRFAKDTDTNPALVNRWANGKARIPGVVAAYFALRMQALELEELQARQSERERPAVVTPCVPGCAPRPVFR